MQKRIFLAVLTTGAIACNTVAVAQAQQGSASARGQAGVLSAAPIYSESMVALQRSAQRLREAIQSLAQEHPGLGRDQAMSNARRALYDTQQAMVQLPPEYRVSGAVVANAPIAQANPAQNRTFGDSMKELQLAADRLRDAIQAMAQRPASQSRNDAISESHQALLQTQTAMAWVPGYGSTASGGEKRPVASSAQGSVSSRPAWGSVMGGGIAAGSDASPVEAKVPAVAGGIGLNARAMLSSEARPDHNVKLVFALNSGNYVADVDVEVTDGEGTTVIDGMSDGPWLYAKLPPGRYTAHATYNGRTVTKQFSVGSSGMREAHFRWPVRVERAAAAGVSPIYGTGQYTAAGAS
jgi:hypothetical protein